jgi:hypothetical protein
LTVSRLVWAIWVAATVLLTFPAFVWHITQFTKPGPAFLTLILCSLAALLGGAALHHALRNTAVHRCSLLAVALLTLGICAVYQPSGTFITVAVAVAAWVLGRAALGRAGMDEEESCAALAIPALTGLGLLTHAFFALGLFGLFQRTTFGIAVLVALVIGRHHLTALPRLCLELHRKWAQDEGLRSPIVSLAIPFTAALAALAAVVTITPSLAADALTFHLNLTRSYIGSGFLRPPETIPYGWFPQAFETLMTASWAFGAQPAAQFVGPLFFLLALLAAASIVRACGYSRAAAVAAAAIVMATPFIHWSGSVVKNDLMLASWQLAALYSVLRWRATRQFRWILLSAFFVGLCLQVKFIVVFGTLPLLALWLIAVWRHEQRWLAAGGLAAILLLFGSFSMARTYLATGNPFHPAAASASVKVGYRASGADSVARFVRLPWLLHFAGKRYFETSSDNPVGVATIVLAPALFAIPGRRRSWAERACWGFVLGYFLYWMSLMAVLRYAIPAFAVLLSLMAARACAAFEASRPATRLALVTAFAYVLAFGWVTTVMIESYPAQLPYLAGRLDADGFLRGSLQPYGAMKFVAGNAAREDWVVALGAYAPVYGHNPDRTLLIDRKPEDFENAHLIEGLSLHPESRWVVLPNGGKGPELARTLSQLRSVSHVYGDPWFSVYRVEP